MPKKCILLEDSVACVQIRGWLSSSYGDERLLKGSLLVELTGAEGRDGRESRSPYANIPFNYKKYSNDSIKLFCKPEQILQLNDKQFNLLLGVKYYSNRYKALNILHWVEKLKVGNAVNVAIPTIPQPVRGIIRYIGTLPDEVGTKFGIEMLVSHCVLIC